MVMVLLSSPRACCLVTRAACFTFLLRVSRACLLACQSAILGMHATKMRPVAIDGKVEVRPVMYLALTYDHRLIDGR